MSLANSISWCWGSACLRDTDVWLGNCTVAQPAIENDNRWFHIFFYFTCVYGYCTCTYFVILFFSFCILVCASALLQTTSKYTKSLKLNFFHISSYTFFFFPFFFHIFIFYFSRIYNGKSTKINTNLSIKHYFIYVESIVQHILTYCWEKGIQWLVGYMEIEKEQLA